MTEQLEKHQSQKKPEDDLQVEVSSRNYLPEIKQFMSFFSIHFFYQKRMTDPELRLKQRMSALYSTMLMQERDDSELQLMSLFQDTLTTESMPSNILKAAFRTIKKLLEYPEYTRQLTAQGFQSNELLQSLYDCKFDCHDQDQEDVILLTIQKIMIKVLATFENVTPDAVSTCCKYFFSILKKRAMGDLTSIHMAEGTKRNMNGLFVCIMTQSSRTIKQRLLQSLSGKLIKNVAKMRDTTSQFTAAQVAVAREYVIFLVKAMNDCVTSVFNDDCLQSDEAVWLLTEHINLLMEFTCVAGETTDIVIRNQAQQLFSILLRKILDLKLPLREQIEILFIKLVLKPLEEIEKQRKIAAKALADSQKSVNSPPQSFTDPQVDLAVFSDNEEQDQPPETEQIAQPREVDYSIKAEGHTSESFELDMSINFLLETLLSLSPDQIAQFFLLYDCQPFSENLIRRSFTLLIKLSELQGGESEFTNLSASYQVISLIIKSLQRFKDSPNATGEKDSSQRNLLAIVEMLEQKSMVQRVVKAANQKPKAFYNLIEELYDQIDEEVAPSVGSKVLLYSRRVKIDCIAETFGGKDQRSIKCLNAYLNRQDYSTHNIQDSLRSFMQTFRMAGIDSQVVFRILEKFAGVYYENDEATFVNGTEAYEFTYLIIVLQTCQHNASIKEKTSLERFYTQAQQIVPESYDTLPKGFVEDVFHKVTKNEIKAPVTRDLLAGYFEPQICDEIQLRLINSAKRLAGGPLTESEFVNTADLQHKQLFEYSNGIDDTVPVSLHQCALRHLVNLITARFCQMNAKAGESRFNQMKKFELTKQLIQANSLFKNTEWVDRLLIDLDKQVNALNRIPKLDNERKLSALADLHSLFWQNFSSLKLSVVLVPKLAPNLLLPHQGNFHYSSFNAVEYKIRSKFNHKCVTEADLCTRYIDSMQSQNRDRQGNDGGQGQVGIFSLVYNYFTETNDPQQDENKRKQEYISSGQHDCDALKQILDTFNLVRLVNVVKNTQQQQAKPAESPASDVESSPSHNEPVEVSQAPSLRQLKNFLKERGISLKMVVDLLASFARENMSARKSILCTEFIKQIFDAAHVELEGDLTPDEATEFKAIRLHVWSQYQQLMQLMVRPSSMTKESKTSQLATGSSEDKLETKSETSDSFDRMSTRSDQLGVGQEAGPQNLALHFLKPPVFSQLDQSLCEQLNKHLILDLYFQSAKEALLHASKTADQEKVNEICKDVQKTLQAIVEEDLTKNDFEEAFLYQRVAELLQPVQKMVQGKISTQASPIRDYVKLPKLLRLMTILMIQSNSDACNNDVVQASLLQMLNSVSAQFQFLEPIPFDKINLCVDAILLKSNNRATKEAQSRGILLEKNHGLSLGILNQVLDICQNILMALQSQSSVVDAATFEVWFKVLKVIQSKVLLSPYISLYKQVSERACNMMKLQVLNFQFYPDHAAKGGRLAVQTVRTSRSDTVSPSKRSQSDSFTNSIDSGSRTSDVQDMEVSKANLKELKSQAKRIFQDILFQLTFAQIEDQFRFLRQMNFYKDTWVQENLIGDWEDEMEGFAQLCQLSVNCMTDVFIYYSTSLQNVSDQLDEHSTVQQLSENFEIFSFLWLNFMKVLLYYAEEASSLSQIGNYTQSSLPLQQSVHDNIQRTMDFLINEKMLLKSMDNLSEISGDSPSVESTADKGLMQSKDALEQEKHKLYITSQDIIGQFWQQSPHDSPQKSPEKKASEIRPQPIKTFEQHEQLQKEVDETAHDQEQSSKPVEEEAVQNATETITTEQKESP